MIFRVVLLREGTLESRGLRAVGLVFLEDLLVDLVQLLVRARVARVGRRELGVAVDRIEERSL